MRVSQWIGCEQFSCPDVKREGYIVPAIEVKPEDIVMVMISEAAPAQPGDYYYAGGEALFEQTTVLAFQDAGAEVSSIRDILKMGIYLTTAVKCGKIGYGLKAGTIEACSLILEKELALFPNVKVLMLMGDVAIKALNAIAKRAGQGRVIPVGSTYKIRGQAYYFQGKRVFPSYLQAGPSFFIEQGKRRIIAEDIGIALRLLK